MGGGAGCERGGRGGGAARQTPASGQGQIAESKRASCRQISALGEFGDIDRNLFFFYSSFPWHRFAAHTFPRSTAAPPLLLPAGLSIPCCPTGAPQNASPAPIWHGWALSLPILVDVVALCNYWSPKLQKEQGEIPFFGKRNAEMYTPTLPGSICGALAGRARQGEGLQK